MYCIVQFLLGMALCTSLMMPGSVTGFAPPRVRVRGTPWSTRMIGRTLPVTVNRPDSHPKSSMARHMSYQLPPGDKNEASALVTSVLTLAGIVLFFVSPLGGIFFAIFNSLLVLSIAIPLTAIVAFQVWQYFNTVEGPCPNCGAPLRVVKSWGVEATPSICLNCGSVVQASDDNERIDMVQVGIPSEEDAISGMSFWDGLWGGGTTRRSSSVTPTDKGERYRRETTIIDVEVEEEDQDATSRWR